MLSTFPRSWCSCTPDGTDGSVAVRWQDQDRFLVVGTDAVRTGNHILWDCSFALRRCDERYDDPTGTLELPTS
jgi:hypothetical protein